MASAYERRQKEAARRILWQRLGAVCVLVLLAGVGWLCIPYLSGNTVGVAPVQPAPTQQPAASSVPAPTQQAQPVAPTSPPASTPAQLAPTPPGGDIFTAVAEGLDRGVLISGMGQLLNEARAEEGLPPLAPDPVLEEAAALHARDMAARVFFDHVSPDGGTLVDRVTQVDYPYCLVAENIAYGQRTLQIVHDAWMNSPGHRANNLLQGVTHFGISLVDDRWVLVLGATAC